MDLISREVAKATGVLRYFTGKPCRNGHVSERYTAYGGCVQCCKVRAADPEIRKQQDTYAREKIKVDLGFWARRKIGVIRCRARAYGIPFDLTWADIVKVVPDNLICPALGVKMVHGEKAHPFNMTLDRIIPARGYVRGNIQLISNRANQIKADITDPEDLQKVLTWMRSL